MTTGSVGNLDGLKEFERNEGNTYKFYNYWLGRIHEVRYEFDLAIEHYKAFLDLDVYKTQEIIQESKNRLKATKQAKKMYQMPNEYELVMPASPINSAYADLSRAFFAGHHELLFLSSRSANEES